MLKARRQHSVSRNILFVIYYEFWSCLNVHMYCDYQNDLFVSITADCGKHQKTNSKRCRRYKTCIRYVACVQASCTRNKCEVLAINLRMRDRMKEGKYYRMWDWMGLVMKSETWSTVKLSGQIRKSSSQRSLSM